MVRVFAVEPTAVQLDWGSLRPGHHAIAVGDHARTVVGDGGPGALVVDGLEPGTTYRVTVDGRAVATAATLVPPRGRLLARVATISDLHLGETSFGFLPTLHSERDIALAHPVVCTAAAIDELLAWGAELLVVKGDLAHTNRLPEYELAGELLGDLPIPTLVLPGNHDGGNHRRNDPAAALAGYGVTLVEDVSVVDVPGLRIVAADTRTPTQAGAINGSADAIVEAATAVDTGVLITLHHQLMTTAVPTHPPPGIPAADAGRFLDTLAAAKPAAMVTSGHTHRHRSRHHGPVLVTEVGSTKDYPGVWAGYLVYEGGVVQTVRRVMAPEAIRWTQRTARMLVGAWGRWSPGRLSDRSISHVWP